MNETIFHLDQNSTHLSGASKMRENIEGFYEKYKLCL